ncbi:unnamed protein product [Prunus brigantina]
MDEEAHAIATTMPRLKHLEMAYHLISTKSALQILSSCTELEFLDLRECWDVQLEDKYLKEKYPKLKVLGTLILDYYGRNEWEDYSDFLDAYEYLAWEFVAGELEDYYDDDDVSYDGMWDDEGRLEELELRFYEGIDQNGDAVYRGYGWPPSP